MKKKPTMIEGIAKLLQDETPTPVMFPAVAPAKRPSAAVTVYPCRKVSGQVVQPVSTGRYKFSEFRIRSVR